MTGYELAAYMLETFVLSFALGAYGSQCLQALHVLRRLPVEVLLLDEEGRVIGRAKQLPGFRRRVRVYAWSGLAALAWWLGDAVATIVRAFL